MSAGLADGRISAREMDTFSLEHHSNSADYYVNHSSFISVGGGGGREEGFFD